MSYSFSKPKMKPCLNGEKHSWKFVRNFVQKTTRTSSSGTTVRLSTKGLYSCAACDARKDGAAGNDACLVRLMSAEQPST